MTGQIIHIEQCGFLTSLQDNGRNGFLQFGVSKGGAMDLNAAKYANILVGNDESETVLEITQSPHRFHFLQDIVVAFTGGGLQPQLKNKNIPLYQPFFITADSVIEFKQQLPGYRLYMAVTGGYKSDLFLNSHSTDLLVKAGGHYGRTLKKDDLLQIKTTQTSIQKNLLAVLQSGAMLKLNTNKPDYKNQIIRVMKSIEWSYLNELSQKYFTTFQYKISTQSNRMGYRLKGELLTTKLSCEIISSAVTQGTIQLTPSGEMIVLMADAQTVGGYPRIAQVIQADLSLFAQKKPGEEIRFQLISLEEAEEIYLKDVQQFNNIKQTLKQLYAG
jgi:antagonist of KipI